MTFRGVCPHVVIPGIALTGYALERNRMPV